MERDRTREGNVNKEARLVAGTKKNLMGQTFIFGKKSYSAQEMIDLLQRRIDAGKAVAMAYAGWQAAIKAEKDTLRRTEVLAQSYKNLLMAMYGESADMLEQFGLVPKKKRKVKITVKEQAIAKARATREARGTMGKKAKLKIKGEVPAAPPGKKSGEK
jgi:hypothetical protein